ncbi:MAG: SDR family oxidoreductase [Alphaproteobacteria bacterium]|jgi:3-oxoacyl-[acyl-carrier protein] reductase|nr:SDR family oxidoreductase [Rhodospirillaceae bacterium]MBT6202934.1 SDR family oxidoreductase [Rhodospirillaceae bacterium]MBT6509271.1 SDR family oxidoreductase [Rhodospirillaceae bacterium]MDG2479977.1 SDR family oxidoreductase [Alphaproteobacteria bacterium]
MLANYDLSGKRALVTGGAGGIGRGTVRAYLRCGASVAINDLPGSPKLAEVVAELTDEGHHVVAAPGDVGDPDDAPRMVSDAIDALGGLDYLVNNAGTPGTKAPIPPADFERQDEDFWNLLLNVNLIGPYRCTKAAAAALRESGGAIVNTASISAFGMGGSSSPYCATKAGLVVLTKEWARALAPDVRVNAIAPGAVDSDWMCRFPGLEESNSWTIPLDRIGTPTDYGEAILFLSAGAGYVTGQTLNVDGGLTT